jgi:hypothetical protein
MLRLVGETRRRIAAGARLAVAIGPPPANAG